MPDTGVGLMARFPELGTVKTRLAANLGDERSLRVYERLLENAVTLTCDLSPADFVRTAHVTPSSRLDAFASRYPGFDALWPQDGSDLGDRMFHAQGTLLSSEGIEKAILIGADIPELDTALIGQARDQLSTHDLVLGPTTDGGYYLIGVTRPMRDLFEQIAWGTSEVLARTLETAGALGLKIAQLTELDDLDTQADLDAFPDIRSMVR